MAARTAANIQGELTEPPNRVRAAGQPNPRAPANVTAPKGRRTQDQIRIQIGLVKNARAQGEMDRRRQPEAGLGHAADHEARPATAGGAGFVDDVETPENAAFGQLDVRAAHAIPPIGDPGVPGGLNGFVKNQGAGGPGFFEKVPPVFGKGFLHRRQGNAVPPGAAWPQHTPLGARGKYGKHYGPWW